MPETTPPISNLRQLLDDDAARFAGAEARLQKKIPDWIGRTDSVKLKTSLQKYLDFVSAHVELLNRFIGEEKISLLPLESKVMNAFIEETETKLFACTDPEVRNACLLAGVQLINHYKISTYGTAAAFANALGMEKAASIFHEAEVNEKQIDDRLSQLAEHEINLRARAPIVLTQ